MWLSPTCVCASQGSQYENVHVHAGRFKLKRNLLYTAVLQHVEGLGCAQGSDLAVAAGSPEAEAASDREARWSADI